MTRNATVAETFHFGKNVYDVERALVLTAGRKSTGEIVIADALPLLGLMHINKAHARTRDLTNPLLCIPFRDGSRIPIDGWHRIWQANEEGVKSLPYILLSAQEADEILICGDKRLHAPVLKRRARTRRT